MKKSSNTEDIIIAIFVVSILLNFYYGFKYSAGFEYASNRDKLIMTILLVNIYGGLLYFFYRFIKWVSIRISKFINK